MEFFLKTQTPTVELKVTAIDASGAKDSCFVGWKRPSAEEGGKLLEEWIALLDNTVEDSAFYATDHPIQQFLRSRIVYIRDYQFVNAEGKPAFRLKDTRTAQENSSAWGEAENCLPWLLDLFLTSSPWWSAFSEALVSSLSNRDTSAKN